MNLVLHSGTRAVPVTIAFIGPDNELQKKKKIPYELRQLAEKRGSKCLVYAQAKPTDGAIIFGHAFCCPTDDPLLGIGVILACSNLAIAANDLGWKLTA